MRIFDLRTRTAAEHDHPPSRRRRPEFPNQKDDSLYFLTSRYSEFGGSRSKLQLQRFIEESWGEMQALGLTWKPSVSTLYRVLKLLDSESRDPHPQRPTFSRA